MIGSLNSVSNCVNGLKAGVTTIGNLAHYYTFEYPGFDMEYLRTTEYMKSIAIMGQFKDQGVFIHSNLDDGYGAQFHDLANLLGWAKIERYIAEELLGARVGHCFGNLFSNPYSRMVFNRAVDKVNTYKTPGSFMNGNTIDYGMELSRNYGALCSYAMADIICQMKHPTGHAIAPVPLTEAIRVPSAEEMVQAHMTVDMMIEKAPYYMDMVDWDKIEAEADLLVVGGNVFFERVINALDDLGVDINHAGEIAAVLKAIGPEQLESAFGAGKKDENAMRGRIPVKPSSIVQTIGAIQEDVLAKQNFDEKEPLSSVNVVIGATDVHEFGKEVIKNVLKSAGAEVFDLGTTVAVSEVADVIIETGCKIVCISTYNGMAYSFGKELVKNLEENGLSDVKIIMGGRLNENLDGADLPEDVSDKLRDLGINTDNDVDTIVATIEQFTA